MSERKLQGYVVRQGTVRGEGGYLPRYHLHWLAKPNRSDRTPPMEQTCFWMPSEGERGLIAEMAKSYGGRVVAVYSKPRPSIEKRLADAKAVGAHEATFQYARAMAEGTIIAGCIHFEGQVYALPRCAKDLQTKIDNANKVKPETASTDTTDHPPGDP